MTDDAELLRRYADERSQAAFTELVERHVGLVYAAALRQLGGAQHRAEDVTQSVFIDLARRARELASRQEIAGWLYTSTHYAAAKLKRGEQRRQTREEEAGIMQEIFANHEPEADWARLRPILDEAMLALPERDRTAILLRFFQGRKFSEVGRQLGLSEDAARMRTDRALEKLREALKRHGIASTTAALTTTLGSPALVAAPAGLAATVANAALAAAGTAGAAVATAGGTILFMSTTTAILGAIAAIAIGVAVYQTRAAHEATAMSATTGAERDALRNRLHDLQDRMAQNAQKSTALQAEVQQLRADRSTAAANPGPDAARAAAIAAQRKTADEKARLDQIAKEVERRRAIRIQQFDTTYSPLYRQLGLSPAQQAQFKALTLEYWDRRNDFAREYPASMPTNDPRFAAAALALSQEAAKTKALMAGAFGDEAVAKIGHFEETIQARPVVAQLADALFYSDTPLAVPQAEQIVDLVAANARNSRGTVDLGSMDATQVLEQARGTLSPVQLAALRQVLAQYDTKAKTANTAQAGK